MKLTTIILASLTIGFWNTAHAFDRYQYQRDMDAYWSAQWEAQDEAEAYEALADRLLANSTATRCIGG